MAEPVPDPSDDDPAVRWGRRVGRLLGYGFALFLLLNLFGRWV